MRGIVVGGLALLFVGSSVPSLAGETSLACTGKFMNYLGSVSDPMDMPVLLNIAADRVVVDGIAFKGDYEITGRTGGDIMFCARDGTGSSCTFQGHVNRYTGKVTLLHLTLDKQGHISSEQQEYEGSCTLARALF